MRNSLRTFILSAKRSKRAFTNSSNYWASWTVTSVQAIVSTEDFEKLSAHGVVKIKLARDCLVEILRKCWSFCSKYRCMMLQTLLFNCKICTTEVREEKINGNTLKCIEQNGAKVAIFSIFLISCLHHKFVGNWKLVYHSATNSLMFKLMLNFFSNFVELTVTQGGGKLEKWREFCNLYKHIELSIGKKSHDGSKNWKLSKISKKSRILAALI